MNYATGSFGAPDKSNPYSNVDDSNYARYSFSGAQKNNFPSFSTTQSASMQYMYEPYKSTPGTLRHQNPSTVMHSYGVQDTVKHGILGVNRDIGTNFHDEQSAKDEYRTISLRSMGFDVGGMAASTVAFSAGSLAIGAVGGFGAASAVGALASSAKEEYFDNYRMTNRVNGMTSGVRGDDGSYGLSGSENVQIAKFIKREGAKDMLMSSDDIETMMSSTQSSGLMNSVGSASGVTAKAKEMQGLLKGLMDAMNSSDIKGLIETMGEFSRMGVASAPMQTQLVHQTKVASEFAGISQGAMHEQVLSAAANAKATGQDARLAALNTLGAAANMGLYQQEGSLSSSMMDKRTFMSASQQANQKTSAYNTTMTAGIDMDMKIIYASEMAKENGTTNEEEFKKIMSKSSHEQTKLIYGKAATNDALSAARFDKSTRRALASQVKDISKDSTHASEIANAVENMESNLGKNVSIERMAQHMSMMTRNSGVVSTPESQERIMADMTMFRRGRMLGGGSKAAGIAYMSRGETKSREYMDAENTMNSHHREIEKSGILNQLRVGWDKFKTMISVDIVGGHEAAGSDIDKRRQRLSVLSTERKIDGRGAAMAMSTVSGQGYSVFEKMEILSDMAGNNDGKIGGSPSRKADKDKSYSEIFSKGYDKSGGGIIGANNGVSAMWSKLITSDDDTDATNSLTIDLMTNDELGSIVGTDVFRSALEKKNDESYNLIGMGIASFSLGYDRHRGDKESNWGAIGATISGLSYLGKSMLGDKIVNGATGGADKLKAENSEHLDTFENSISYMRTVSTRTKNDDAKAIKFADFMKSKRDGTSESDYTESESAEIIQKLEDGDDVRTITSSKTGRIKRLNRGETKRLSKMYGDLKKKDSGSASEKMSSMLTGDKNSVLDYGKGVTASISGGKEIGRIMEGKSNESITAMSEALIYGSKSEQNVQFKKNNISAADQKILKSSAQEMKKSILGTGQASKITKSRQAEIVSSLRAKSKANGEKGLFGGRYASEGLKTSDLKDLSLGEKQSAVDSGRLTKKDTQFIKLDILKMKAAGKEGGKMVGVAAKGLKEDEIAQSVSTISALSGFGLKGEDKAGLIAATAKGGEKDDWNGRYNKALDSMDKSAAFSDMSDIEKQETADSVAKLVTSAKGDSKKAKGMALYGQESADNAEKALGDSFKSVMGLTSDKQMKEVQDIIGDKDKNRGQRAVALTMYQSKNKLKIQSEDKIFGQMAQDNTFGGRGTLSAKGETMTAKDYAKASGGDSIPILGKIAENTGKMVDAIKQGLGE